MWQVDLLKQQDPMGGILLGITTENAHTYKRSVGIILCNQEKQIRIIHTAIIISMQIKNMLLGQSWTTCEYDNE
jgi:hypothetical protein